MQADRRDRESEMEASELYQMARARLEAEAFQEAVVLFNRSIELFPHFKALELLGECYARMGQLRSAIVPLAAATTLNRQSRAPSILAEVFERLGEQDEALQMARLALERDNRNRRAKGVVSRLGGRKVT